MSYEYGLGGTERKLDNANEAIADIQLNKTLFVQKLTAEAPQFPQMVKDLKTLDEVFQHFQPTIEIDFTTEEGSTKSETVAFKNLGSFGSKGIAESSTYLKELGEKKDQHTKIIKELKSNKTIQTALQNKDSKEVFLSAILAMIKELEEAGA